MIPENPTDFTSAERPTNPADLAPALLDALREQFPVLADFKPLKIGIHQDLIAALPDVDRTALKIALRWHVSRHRYLKSLAKGGDRYGLDEQPAGEITEEHRARCRRLLRIVIQNHGFAAQRRRRPAVRQAGQSRLLSKRRPRRLDEFLPRRVNCRVQGPQQARCGMSAPHPLLSLRGEGKE